MFTIVATRQFLREAGKFFDRHPDLRPRFASVVGDLAEDPFAPHLDLHALGGKLRGVHAVRLRADYRITLTIMVSEREITLLDIGSHDEVYR